MRALQHFLHGFQASLPTLIVISIKSAWKMEPGKPRPDCRRNRSTRDQCDGRVGVTCTHHSPVPPRVFRETRPEGHPGAIEEVMNGSFKDLSASWQADGVGNEWRGVFLSVQTGLARALGERKQRGDRKISWEGGGRGAGGPMCYNSFLQQGAY